MADKTIDAPARIGRLTDAIRDLEAWGRAREWRGSDPYEGLNARGMKLLKRTPLGRRILIQLVKRSPLDLRPALGIRPDWDAAALGHLLTAYARLDRLDAAGPRDQLESIVQRLGVLRCDGFPEPCWGYHFDVETRVFGYPRTTPNTIATSFVGLGLVEAHDAVGDPSLLETAAAVGEFLLRRVPRIESREGACFGYFPGDRTPIHNANMLACGVLAQLAARTGREDFREAALAGAAFAVAHQRADGSWPYAERPGLRWVDGHHTGYVLDSIRRCAEIDEGSALTEAYERGLRFYATRLFLADGTPRHFEDRTHPIDAQCAAQGISTFSIAAAGDPGWLAQAWRVYEFAIARLRRADGAFAFQRGRLLVNATPHIRWVQAPMLDALTGLLAAATQMPDDGRHGT